ncbi:VapE domain-containing protein, partial [uncultured Bacteroides sp.]|uniref:VapE domain-containing protein n=1 Tax=uncultured Bacteroides sp. TaxID=162156 RepID=UPI00259B9937
VRLAKREFGQEYPDVESPLHNAYIYTDKTNEAAAKKEEKKPVISQVMDFLGEHYGIRRNLILDRLEFMPYAPPEEARKGYRPMRGKDYNTLFVDLQMAGISCYQNFLRAVIDSNYAKEFNPYTDYLYALPPWDGTDYIAQLADTLTTENRELWQEGFKRWMVGMVACALSDEEMNQLVIILYSEQGKGKSSWIRHLLPPEWKEYFYNGMIDPSNKDDARLLSTRIIINMEEFEGVRPGELAALKRIIAQDNVTQRKAYDVEAFTLPRHCSFIGSTNNRQCLQDIGGNRRFLPITVTGIDYRTPVIHPGIYAQALALLKGGFRYWYEGEEIEQLNKHNERHRMKDPVEENLFVFFRKPLPEDLQVKWLPASVILTKLSIFGKVQVNPHTQLVLVQALEKYGFGTRTNEQETTEYEVVDIQLYQ